MNETTKPQPTTGREWGSLILQEWRAGLLGLFLGILTLILIRADRPFAEVTSPLILQQPGGVFYDREPTEHRLKVDADGRLVEDLSNQYIRAQKGLELQVDRLFLCGHSELAFRAVEAVRNHDTRRRLLLVIVDRVRSVKTPRGLSEEQIQRIREGSAPEAAPAPSDAAPTVGPVTAEEPLTRKDVQEIVRIVVDQLIQQPQGFAPQQQQTDAQDKTAENRWVESVKQDLTRARELAQSLPSSARGEVLLAIASEADALQLLSSDERDAAIEALRGGFWGSALGTWMLWIANQVGAILVVLIPTVAAPIFFFHYRRAYGTGEQRPTRRRNRK